MHQHRPNPVNPDSDKQPRASEQDKPTNTLPIPSYWLQGSIHRVGCDAGEQAKPTDQIPSPLMGEESKVRVKTMHRIVTSLRT